MKTSHNGIKDILSYQKKLISTIVHYLPDCEIILFGSRAMGTNQPSSDIDICIRNRNKVEPSLLYTISEAIDALNVPFFVDLVDYYAVYDEMRTLIDKTGITWKTMS